LTALLPQLSLLAAMSKSLALTESSTARHQTFFLVAMAVVGGDGVVNENQHSHSTPFSPPAAIIACAPPLPILQG